ncbi:MAG: DUF488 domain-containing protein, partial [Hyphomicrobiales bacterium]|nr:DUF488 domain-containing protein [Hyphomicrobiales bacterium]
MRPITSPFTREACSTGSDDSSIFFTIGHSTRPVEEFIGLLREANVRLVVDVRSVPRSRANPQYDRDVLSRELAAHQIGYEHLTALGGLRGRQREVPSDVNAFWQNESFHNYADYALSQTFRDALARLQELGHASTCAVMCAEAVWWRCHRRIIADYLLAAHECVFHILGPHNIVPAQMTQAARRRLRGTLIYPA